MNKLHSALATLPFLFFAACGSGGSGDPDPIASQPPAIPQVAGLYRLSQADLQECRELFGQDVQVTQNGNQLQAQWYVDPLPGENLGQIIETYVAIQRDCVWMRAEMVGDGEAMQSLLEELLQMVDSIRFIAHAP